MKNSLSTASAPLLLLACCFMAGMVAGSCWPVAVWWWAALAGLVVLSAGLRNRGALQSLALAGCMAVAGALLMSLEQQRKERFFGCSERPFRAVIVSSPVEKARTVAVDAVTISSQWPVRCYIYNKEEGRRFGIGQTLLVGQRPEAPRGAAPAHCLLRTGQWRRVATLQSQLPLLLRSRLWFLHQRQLLLQRYRALGAANDAQAVVAAMTLGDRSRLSARLRSAYAGTGAAHVLALSGLHLGMVCSLLLLVVRGRRWHPLAQGVLVVAIWAFAFLVALPASVVRAATMLSVYALLSMGRRRGLSVNVLAFTAMVMLVASPLSLFDVGFQLSFAAVFAILALMPLWDSWVSAQWLQGHRLAGWLWSLVTISVSAQVGTAPLVAYYFGQFPVCFLLTNLVAVPAVWLLLHGALLMLLLPVAAPAVLALAHGLNAFMLWLAAQPWASIGGLHPTALQVALAYVAIAAVVAALMRLQRQG